MKVTILDESVEIADAFEYSTDLTPSITSVAPDVLTVAGGVIVRIQGTSFDSTSGSSPKVTIGNKTCSIVNASATELFCVAPANPPGKHHLHVLVDGKGIAQSSDLLDYVLSVNNVYPMQGSVLGGTVVTLEGVGFLLNSSKMHVSIGEKRCDIISSTNELIKCKTQQATNVFVVDNSGRHPCMILHISYFQFTSSTFHLVFYVLHVVLCVLHVVLCVLHVACCML